MSAVSELPQPKPVRRVRLVAVTMQLQLVADDGEELEPLRVDPVTVYGKDWAQFDMDAIIADVAAQIGAQE